LPHPVIAHDFKAKKRISLSDLRQNVRSQGMDGLQSQAATPQPHTDRDGH
jgi:hypothetical protein